jgi:hypothetical protein
MSEKFNQLIELFIAEEQDKAKELFHELVVDKSREIYENLIDEEDFEEQTAITGDEKDDPKKKGGWKAITGDEKDDPKKKGGWKAITGDEKDDPKKGGSRAITDSEEFDAEPELGGDAADDLINDITADEAGLTIEDDDEEDLEDRVVDLEDALDDLKAEFEQIMAGEEGEEELDLEPEMGDEEELELEPELGDDGELELELDGEEELEDSFNPNMVREYTEKAPAPVTTEQGDGKAGPVAGANKMGGTAQNIVSGSGEEKGRTAPTAKEQTTSTPVTGKQVAATKAVTKPSAEGNTVSPVRKA